MAYTLIDEKRNIWGCRLEQLPFSKLKHITDTWGDDPVNSIVFFGEKEDDGDDIRIVMNMSSEDFENDLGVFQVFMDASKRTRAAILDEYPDSEYLHALNEVLFKREALKISRIIKYNTHVNIKGFISPHRGYFDLLKKEPFAVALYRAYTYGFALGKKSERARRKQAKVWENEKTEG